MKRSLLYFSLLGLVFVFGCAPNVAKDKEPVFFPPAPDPPRIQYLLGIGNSQDVDGGEVEFKLVSTLASSSGEVKQFLKPYGVAAFGTRIYVTDTLAGRIAVIDLQQKSFDWLKGDFGPGTLKKPVNMAVDTDGLLYVADTVKRKVLVYDQEGNFVRTYAEEQDVNPVDVEVDKKYVYVLDRDRGKILMFDKKKGRLRDSLGQHNEDRKDNLALPVSMALNNEGLFYISNVGTGQIIQMDRDGHVLNKLGSIGDGFGQFGRPRGVAIDNERRLFAVDAAHQNVQLFNGDGRLLMFFGSPGLPEGSLNLPAGIDVSDQALDFYQKYAAPDFKLEQVIFVVSQVGRRLINVYGMGKQSGIDYERYYKETLEVNRKTAERLEKKEVGDKKDK